MQLKYEMAMKLNNNDNNDNNEITLHKQIVAEIIASEIGAMSRGFYGSPIINFVLIANVVEFFGAKLG